MKPRIDRRAVMTDAWGRWRYAQRRGWHLGDGDVWTWGRCLALAWAAARQRRDEVAAYHARPRTRRVVDAPFPIAARDPFPPSARHALSPTPYFHIG